MTQPTDAVIVAIDLDGSPAAVDVGAREALLSNAPLHVVHILDVRGVSAYAGVYGGVLDKITSTLDHAGRRARAVCGKKVPVTTERVDAAGLVAQLVARADRGRLIVLQHRRHARAWRMVTGSTVASVAARASVPVLSVPDQWTPVDRPPVVAVGVQDVLEAERLLRIAGEEAQRLGARLVVTHGAKYPRGYDPATLEESHGDEHLAVVRGTFEQQLGPFREEFPELTVEVDVRHAAAAEALVDVSSRADLLVIGRRHHLLPLGGHLGPVARAILDHSACPVLLAAEAVPKPHHRPAPDLSGVMY